MDHQIQWFLKVGKEYNFKIVAPSIPIIYMLVYLVESYLKDYFLMDWRQLPQLCWFSLRLGMFQRNQFWWKVSLGQSHELYSLVFPLLLVHHCIQGSLAQYWRIFLIGFLSSKIPYFCDYLYYLVRLMFCLNLVRIERFPNHIQG